MTLLSTICHSITHSLGVSCHSWQGRENPSPKSWAERMAIAVIQRSDSLVKYNNPRTVKWQYDLAFLGQAIDRLGYLNPAYSNYMQSYMDYFISEDGKSKHISWKTIILTISTPERI